MIELMVLLLVVVVYNIALLTWARHQNYRTRVLVFVATSVVLTTMFITFVGWIISLQGG